jgi:hypothetical protein
MADYPPGINHPTDTPGRDSTSTGARVGYWTGGKGQTMTAKTTDHPRKTTVNRGKTTVNPRISTRCYKSFRLNGTIFRRNSRSSKDLELPRAYVELKCNAGKGLRPKSTDGPNGESTTPYIEWTCAERIRIHLAETLYKV